MGAFRLQEITSESELAAILPLHNLAHEDPFNAFYTLDRGDTDEAEHASRFLCAFALEGCSRWVVVVNEENGETVGAAEWIVYENGGKHGNRRVKSDGRDEEMGSNDHDHDQEEEKMLWWEEGEARAFAQYVTRKWEDERMRYGDWTRNPHILLNACFVHPIYRKRSVGSMLMGWGLYLADQHCLPVYIEAVKEGKQFYEKHGFEALHKVQICAGKDAEPKSEKWKACEKRLRMPLEYWFMYRASVSGVMIKVAGDQKIHG